MIGDLRKAVPEGSGAAFGTDGIITRKLKGVIQGTRKGDKYDEDREIESCKGMG